jgi:hypothetical protein
VLLALLFTCVTNQIFNALIHGLHGQNMELKREEEFSGFLGVHID